MSFTSYCRSHRTVVHIVLRRSSASLASANGMAKLFSKYKVIVTVQTCQSVTITIAEKNNAIQNVYNPLLKEFRHMM